MPSNNLEAHRFLLNIYVISNIKLLFHYELFCRSMQGQSPICTFFILENLTFQIQRQNKVKFLNLRHRVYDWIREIEFPEVKH